jgi:glycosyltransferase involved in cell wall biosynthesis
MDNPDLLVSVCVITHNQSRYIGKCLESIVTQKVEFEYEIIVGDDCSTDGAKDIILDYVNRYPNLIKAIFRGKNIGARENYIDTHRRARGFYVAQIDGDDYMLPDKLSMQVNFFQTNPSVALVGHQCIEVDAFGSGIRFRDKLHPNISDTKYLLNNTMFFVNSSVMYKRRIRADRKWMQENYPIIDFTICIEDSFFGKIGFINLPLVAYRLSEKSMTRGPDANLRVLTDLTIEGYQRAEDLGFYRRFCRSALAKYLFKASIFFARIGDEESCRIYLKKMSDMRYIDIGYIAPLAFIARTPMLVRLLMVLFGSSVRR